MLPVSAAAPLQLLPLCSLTFTFGGGGGDVAVYVSDINQPSSPTPFYSVLVSVSVFMALSTVFHSISSPGDSPLSHSVLLVLFPPYWSFHLCISFWKSPSALIYSPCSGELRTQKLKSHLVRTQSLNVLPLKPGVGQYTATHAPLIARDFFLAYFYPSGPFICIFSKTFPDFPCVGSV